MAYKSPFPTQGDGIGLTKPAPQRVAPDIVVVHDDVAAFWSPTDAWQATEGDYDLGCTVGRGRTPLAAIVDLLDQLEG